MTLEEIRTLCRHGKIGLVPKWKGYIKYNYGLNELQFVNGDYTMRQSELEDKLKDRNDLFYII